MTETNKIKIEVSTCHFMKWYESGYTDQRINTVTVNLNELPSIRVITKKEIPYLNYYLVLDERQQEILYAELKKAILNKYENVTTVDMNSHSQKIYSPDFKREIGSWRKIFNIPSEQNTQKLHKSKSYEKYFNKDLFEKADDKKKPFSSEYIGFTGRNNEDLSKGKEIRCEVFFTNTQESKIEYMFIENIYVVSKKWSTGPVSEYYIMPEDFIGQFQREIQKLARKHNYIKEIKVQCNFFDEAIKVYDQISIDKFKLEQNISYYFILNYQIDNKIQLVKTEKGKHQNFIESKITGSSNITYDEYDDLERKHGHLNYENDYHDDDSKDAFYSSQI